MRKQNPKLVKLMSLLADGECHSGDELGEILQMTRSAVWKIINKLKSYGINIESIKGTGYLLKEPVLLLDKTKIKKNLLTKSINLDVFESISSTNDYLKRIKNPNQIYLCLAEEQQVGQGRLGRNWYSPFAENIYFSCLYPLCKEVSELGGLSLIAGLAIVKTIKEVAPNLDVLVKWPNDVLIGGKKTAGTLVLLQAESHGKCHAIIGIGLNVNMQDDNHSIKQDYTSLRLASGVSYDRNGIVSVLANNLFLYLEEFQKSGFQSFIKEWHHHDILFNKNIAVNNVGNIIKGKVTGVNESGHLLLKLTNGKTQAFTSGDVTIVR